MAVPEAFERVLLEADSLSRVTGERREGLFHCDCLVIG
jgi:hypothetical protein